MSILALALALPLPLPQAAPEEALWIRTPALSPDGTRVAFSYGGDLWVAPVSADGAPVEAELLTTHVGYERGPVWAPDSRTIAFAADWAGQLDVYVTTVDRAPARRLTFHSTTDLPAAFSPDGSEVWFQSARQDTAEARLGSTFLPELYAIDFEGGAPRRLLTTPAVDAKPSADGSLVLYEDLKAYEDEWRKHHQSSHARDLWVWDRRTGEHRQLTTWRGEDRDPVWMPGEEELAFLSERGGTFDVWVTSLADPGEARNLTRHGGGPVRFLSAASDGTLAYTHAGALHVLAPGGECVRQTIVARLDRRQNEIEHVTLRKDATEMAVSPHGSEVAFVVRGEVFVADTDHGTTRRVTETPEQERGVTWGADGRTLYYAGERDGSWNLYSSAIVRDEEEGFASSTLLHHETVLANGHETFQPVVSPDGETLAFLSDREALCLLDLESGEVRELVSDEWNYSYVDGDLSFAWAPDSRWLTLTYSPFQRWTAEVGLVNVETGELIDLTTSGFDESAPSFAPDGSMIVYRTGRYGQREPNGQGGQSDLVATYLTQEAHDRALLSWEDHERLQEREKKQEEAEAKEEEDDDGEAAETDDEPAVDPLRFERDDLEHRRRRLTLQSAPMGAYVVTPDGEAVIYFAQVDGKWGLWTSHLRERKTQALLPSTAGPGQLHLSEDGKTLVVLSGGRIQVAKISGGEHDLPEGAKPEPVAFAAEMTVDGPAERAYMFEHAWRQVREKFYREDLHGADWDGLKATYASYLPHVTNGHDFAELLSEMLGELNASHTGARHRPRIEERDETASLGLIYGELTEEGLRVAEVIARGPCDRAESNVTAGVHITAIDGHALQPDENPWPLLDRKDQKPVLLTVRTADGELHEEVLKPISSGAERELLYRRWVERSEALVDELSGGRLGYVHVRGMNNGSYREVYDQVLGHCSDKEALVVDTRWNGGGWLHDNLLTFLGGEEYVAFVPRDKEPGRFGHEPLARWARPVCVVQNEGNYSDAHFFPYAFHTLGLGKLIGTPVAGTATAVWWERMIDGATTFGIPQVGIQDRSGRYLENQELFPDVEVYNDAESIAAGRDRQLEEAVRVMLEDLEESGETMAQGGTR